MALQLVHPHVRGDYGWPRPEGMSSVSVHPHVRGDYEMPPHLEGAGHRSIPTCVGTTRRWTGCVRSMSGPSPRAWGLQGVEREPLRGHRSIPTCVGTTTSSWPPTGRSPVHPHVRGDYTTSTLRKAGVSGPSPRAWGLRGGEAGEGRGRRSIPTCVGTTHLRAQALQRAPVHPHVRGDYGPGGLASTTKGLRSIPTCVGTTGQHRRR